MTGYDAAVTSFLDRYFIIRKSTEDLAAPLAVEDCVIQSMPDMSPTRWHLAHTTWFFETFALAQASPKYEPVHPAYQYLFNSYYNSVGEQFPRPKRGLLSRPTMAQGMEYRRIVDERIRALFREDRDVLEPLLPVVELGLNHEQQHQELILTDIKHVLSCNPLYPVYRETAFAPHESPGTTEWKPFLEGMYWIGHSGKYIRPDLRPILPGKQAAAWKEGQDNPKSIG
jgi:hypothetical protein